VITASMTTPAPAPIPDPSAGTPRLLAFSGPLGSTQATRSAASTAPPNCMIQYHPASLGEIRRVSRKPSVTAGLKKPPEMNPIAETMTPITRPLARARSVAVRAYAAPPQAMKINANVPMNSAAPRRR
jgi:hypothetical protein